MFIKFAWFFQLAPAFLEKQKVREKGWVYFPEAGPWGTGPFEFIEGVGLYSQPSDRIVLEAYEDYWDPHYPKVKRVIFENTLIENRDEAMRLCEEEEGAVDIVSRIRPLDTLKVAESPFAKVMKSRDVAPLGCFINGRKRNSKWRDIRLRKALNYAINREELWKYGAKGNAYNLGGFIPPGAFRHNPDLKLYTYNTEKARALIAEAGYPEGFEVKLIAFEGWKLEAQIISKMLERVGLKVKLDIKTWPEYLRKTYIPILDRPPEEQDWDMTIGYWHDFFANTGASFLTWGYIDESDWRWIQYDAAYEEIWQEMIRTVDKEAQEEKIRQMAKYTYDRCYSLSIYSPITLYAVNKEVYFVPQKCGHMRLKETSVTDKHWSVREQDK